MIAETAKSKLVICQTGTNDFYYRGAGNNNAGGGIELSGAVRASGGFEVTNQTDGTKYQIRPGGLTVSMPGKDPWSETMLQYASS